MKRFTKPIQWKELIDNSDDSGSTLLVGEPPKQLPDQIDHLAIIQDGYFAVTINPPRIKKYLQCNSSEQKKVLYKLWNRIVALYDCSCKHVYEFCQDGQVHLHGYIRIHTRGIIVGAINDIAKFVHNYFRQPIKTTAYYAQYARWRSPCVCVQYFKDVTQWETYMNKHQG